MMKAVPPLNEVFRQAGMDLPKFLGEENVTADSEADSAAGSAPDVPPVSAPEVNPKENGRYTG
jgi:hypothetical protein